MTDDEIEQRMRRTVAVVQATSTEQFFLWKEWAKDSGWDDLDYIKRGGTPHPKLKWEQMNPGSWLTIGHVNKMPVCISLTWNRIEGQVVLFWEMTSQVVDYRMGEKYLEKVLDPWPKYDNGSRHASSDAMNFHNMVSAIRQAAGIER